MTVYCEDCDFVEGVSKKGQPYSWLCLKAPRQVEPGFVKRNVYVNGEPFFRCRDVNMSGECKSFKPLKDVTKGDQQ